MRSCPAGRPAGTTSTTPHGSEKLETTTSPLPVFYLASDLGPTAEARQLALLAAGLPRERFRVEVGVLGPATTPIAADLRAGGVPVHPVPLRRAVDVRGMRVLRSAVAEARPAVLHAWGADAVRAARVATPGRAGRGHEPRTVVSAAAVPGGGLLGWLTTRLVRRADRVAAASCADADRYRRIGVPPERISHIPPGVAPPPPPPPRDRFLRELGLPPNARLIATAGRIEPSPGMKAAVWAFDMLRYPYPDLYLLIFGTGPDRAGLEAFGRALAFDDFRIRFPGCRPDLPAVLGLADVVWVLRDQGGVSLMLEAMAAGRPVVGWKTPDASEVVEDGVSGFLVGAGERAQVSARTYWLLHEPAAGETVCRAGRARAAAVFGTGRMVEQFARLYEDAAGA